MISKVAAVSAAGVLAMAGLATSAAAHATPAPSVTATPSCGKVTIHVNNPHAHALLKLQVQVDAGPVRTHAVVAAGSTVVPLSFAEDSGRHLVRWRLWGGPERDWDRPSWKLGVGAHLGFHERGFGDRWADTIRVDSDCRPDRARPVRADAPEAVQPHCRGQWGRLVIPRERGVVYKVDGEVRRPGEHRVRPGRYRVTAHATDGYRLVGERAWKHAVHRGGACERPGPDVEVREATPAAPVLTQATCADKRATIAIPEAEGVVYRSARGAELKQGTTYRVDAGRLVVTAEAADGYELAEDAQTRWPFTVAGAPDCPVSEPVTQVVVVNDAPVPTRVDTGLGGLAVRR